MWLPILWLLILKQFSFNSQQQFCSPLHSIHVFATQNGNETMNRVRICCRPYLVTRKNVKIWICWTPHSVTSENCYICGYSLMSHFNGDTNKVSAILRKKLHRGSIVFGLTNCIFTFSSSECVDSLILFCRQ